MEVNTSFIRSFKMEEKEITLEIRAEGIVVFNRQNDKLLNDTLDIISQFNCSDDSIKEFLEGRKRISLIIGNEIFCG